MRKFEIGKRLGRFDPTVQYSIAAASLAVKDAGIDMTKPGSGPAVHCGRYDA